MNYDRGHREAVSGAACFVFTVRTTVVRGGGYQLVAVDCIRLVVSAAFSSLNAGEIYSDPECAKQTNFTAPIPSLLLVVDPHCFENPRPVDRYFDGEATGS